VPIRVVARPPSSLPPPRSNLDVSGVLEDAAHYPGGHATAIVRPASLDELSAALQTGERLLPIGAQSSLTGGATPFGDTVVVTSGLNGIQTRGDRVAVGAGVPLQTLQEELAATGRWFPPVPTYLGAFAGGAVATCAAGAATFKYGTVREWVDGLTIVLAGGDVLSLSRGEYVADEAGFAIETSTGVRTIRIPDIRMPDVPKKSAGYFLAPGMDLIDLFIGSEGTLGVIAQAVFKTAALPAAVCRALVPVPSEPAAIELVGALRAAAPASIDIAANEHLDARSIAVIREDGIDRKLGVALPSGAAVVLLIDLELPQAGVEELWQQLESAREATNDSPLLWFCRLLDRFGVLDDTEIALPGDRTRAAAFAELREAVPAGVNRRVALARQGDPAISKTAADMIVPFARFAGMMAVCRQLFAERGLDLAVWGHISDGNVHPNVIPRSSADVAKGRDAILELGAAVIEMGGCPLAEHGVGRSAIKQQLLRQLYGIAGIDAMRAIKLSLDPHGSLARGVIFPTQ
jgi:D-lactate dehydrogenase (cytochrome)